MKYHRMRHAKSATFASLALVVTLIACIQATPQASTSTTQAVSEAALGATTESPAALVDQILPSPEPSTAAPAAAVPAAAGAESDPVLVEVVPAPAVLAPPVAPAPPTAAAPQETTPSVTPPAADPVGPAAGECTPANIDMQRHDTVRAINPIPAEQQQHYTVLGCAEGWLAYAISDEGVRAAGLDGGNVNYSLARLQNDGRFLTDFAQLWSTVRSWDFLAFYVRDGRYATVQEAMDDEFATYGIPVRLREQLVGAGPDAPAPGTAAGECTPANIDIQRHDQVRAIKPIPAEQQQYYTVLGCAEGWLAYAISDEGVRAAKLDGGNVYYSLARLQNDGRFLTDFAQLWSTVHNWEFLAFDVRDGRYATVQEAMDDQFATYGIPVRLREQLVGSGPATGTP